MNVQELINRTGWTAPAAEGLEKEIKGGCCGDLLSWVMGRGPAGSAWITVQVHRNVVAIASLREFACIILADDAKCPEDLAELARRERIPILESGLPIYQTAKKLAELGI
jgi:hypothetical protein